MNEKRKKYKNPIFKVFKINTEKIDITERLKNMRIKEYNDMKLITTSIRPSRLKNENNLLKSREIDKSLPNKKNENFPSVKKMKIPLSKKKVFL